VNFHSDGRKQVALAPGKREKEEKHDPENNDDLRKKRDTECRKGYYWIDWEVFVQPE